MRIMIEYTCQGTKSTFPLFPSSNMLSIRRWPKVLSSKLELITKNYNLQTREGNSYSYFILATKAFNVNKVKKSYKIVPEGLILHT